MAVQAGNLLKNRKLIVGIPASLCSDVPHLREKTLKIGYIGRAAAIFCVDEFIVFPDLPRNDQKHESVLLKTILSYMETPQYLRKHLFKINPELRYAGILPPLRTTHHPLSRTLKNLDLDEYREGVVINSSVNGSFVDIGVESPILIPKNRLPINTRVTVKITKLGKGPEATLVNRDEKKKCWGYRITISKVPLVNLLKKARFDLVIATSRYGTPILKTVNKLLTRWKNSNSIFVLFGAPTQGLHKIVKHENKVLNEVTDFIVNTIPNQGTKTVRTEEAIHASLAILNLLTNDHN